MVVDYAATTHTKERNNDDDNENQNRHAEQSCAAARTIQILKLTRTLVKLAIADLLCIVVRTSATITENMGLCLFLDPPEPK